MSKSSNAFKESLKHNILGQDFNNSKPNYSSIYKILELDNLPEDIEANISEDLKYLNLKIKDSSPTDNHLTFQVPLKEEDFSFYKNHPQSDYINNRYDTYDIDYQAQIEEYAQNEKRFLNEKFPNINLYTRIRMKSRPSYQKKINDRIKKGLGYIIDDIIAERIIISNVDGNEDPKLLEDACYTVAQALEEYRNNYTNFKLKDIKIIGDSGKSDKNYITKDYISHPKPSGYKSLHIITENKDNPDFTYETQIRTYDMEQASKLDSKISHKNYKHRFFDDSSILKVPKYIDVTNFKESNGDPLVYRVPIKYAFHHYYGENIDKFRNELNYIQQFIKFEDIRQKLREINKQQLDISNISKNNFTESFLDITKKTFEK